MKRILKCLLILTIQMVSVYTPLYFLVYGAVYVLALVMGWEPELVAGVPADALIALVLLVPTRIEFLKICHVAEWGW